MSHYGFIFIFSQPKPFGLMNATIVVWNKFVTIKLFWLIFIVLVSIQIHTCVRTSHTHIHTSGNMDTCMSCNFRNSKLYGHKYEIVRTQVWDVIANIVNCTDTSMSWYGHKYEMVRTQVWGRSTRNTFFRSSGANFFNINTYFEKLIMVKCLF